VTTAEASPPRSAAADPHQGRSGFIVNMCDPYLIAAVRMYEEGSPPARTSTRACDWAAGTDGTRPLCDFIGLDVLYAVCGSGYEEFNDPSTRRAVAEAHGRLGHHGRKVGKGSTILVGRYLNWVKLYASLVT